MADSARGSLNAERASTRASLLTEDEIKSLQLQVKLPGSVTNNKLTNDLATSVP